MTDFAAALAGVSQEHLDNGLRLVLAPDSSVPVVAVNLWYAVARATSGRARQGSPICSST